MSGETSAGLTVTVAALGSEGLLMTAARLWTSRLIAPTARAISSSARRPASMNRGWNWWQK